MRWNAVETYLERRCTAYKIALPSQGDADFEATNVLTIFPSLSSQFTGQLVTLNTLLNAQSTLGAVKNILLGGMGTLLLWLQNGHTHPLEAHGMSQIIFGLVGQDVYGYAP